MLGSLVVAAVLVLAMLIGIFLYIDFKNKKIQEEKRKALTDLANNVKARFRIDVIELSEALDLPSALKARLLMVGNNYFVYQPVNETNVDSLTFCLDKLSTQFSRLSEHVNETGSNELPLEHITQFTQGLPASNRGFNAKFYSESLLGLSLALDLPEQNDMQEHEDSEALRQPEAVAS